MNRFNLKPLSLVIAPLALAAAVAAPGAYAQGPYASLEAPAVAASRAPSADAWYAEGMDLRQAGDDKAAFEAFLKAAQLGHATAQRRLGEIYDRGNGAVERDYVESIRWYQMSRAQGEQIAMPLRRSFGVVGYGG